MTLQEWMEKHEDKYLTGKNPDTIPMVEVLTAIKAAGALAGDGIGGASHDIIWLSYDTDKLEAAMTDELAITLQVNGVHWSSDADCLAMFA